VIEAMLLKRQGQGRHKTIADLKLAASALAFIQEHDIQDLAGFREVVGGFYSRQAGINDKLKKVERRGETLDEHIKQSETYKTNRGYKTRYDKLYAEYKTALKASGMGTKRKAQKALEAADDYHEKFRAEITLCEAAERYIKGVLNGRNAVPLDDWKAERAKLEGEKQSLYQEYYTLKDEVKQVEAIRRHVEELVREESRERQPIKAQEREL
jgi:hypothetical protein